MAQLLTNAARALLTSAILGTDTSVPIEAAKADLFPVANTGTGTVGTGGLDYFKAVLQDTSGNIEIIYVRSRASGAAIFSNVIRAQEGTTARAFAAGSVLGLRITALDQSAAIDLAAAATAQGKLILNAATAAAQRTALGSTATGGAVFIAATAAAARTSLGATTVGAEVFIAAGALEGRAALGAAASGPLLTSGITGAAYLNIPQNSQSADYTIVATDAAKHIFHPTADVTARTWTIPANAAVALEIGTAITLINQNAAGVITVAITTDVMRLAGQGTAGSRALAANGVATILKVTATEWIISGTGLS